MATDILKRLREEALGLTEAERIDLARALIESLDAPADPDATDAWDREIVRRLAEIDTGTASLIDRDEFRNRMKARLGSR